MQPEDGPINHARSTRGGSGSSHVEPACARQNDTARTCTACHRGVSAITPHFGTERTRRENYFIRALYRGYLVMHFKFDGQVLWFDDPKAAIQRNVHVDVTFETNEG